MKWVLCTVLVVLLSSSAAAATEIEGLGEASIIGGNLVSARRRAMNSARRNAVAQAAETKLGPAETVRLAGVLGSRIYPRASRYILRYRVLDESSRGGQFHIRIAASLNTKTLYLDLKKLLQQGKGSAQPGAGQLVGVWLNPRGVKDPRPRARLAKELVRRLGIKGIKTVSLPTGEVAAARARKIPLLLTVTISTRRTAGVRGLALAGGEGQVIALLTKVSDGTEIVREKFIEYGVATSEDLALYAAGNRALGRVISPMVRAIRARWPVSRARPGRFVLHISALDTSEQLRRIERALRQKIVGVQGCTPRRIDRRRASLLVQASADTTARALARVLTSHPFETFELKLKEIEGGSIWVTAAQRSAPGS